MYTIFLRACTAGGCGPNAVVTAITPPGEVLCDNTINLLNFLLTLLVPPSKPSVVYLKVSSLTSVDNHQNDGTLSLFQDEVSG